MRITNLVEYALKTYPATRNSDKLLQLVVWEELGFYLSDKQKQKYMAMPSTETIRRIRQKFQERGNYEASEGVKKSRRIKGLVMAQNAPSASVERSEDILEANFISTVKQMELM